VTIRNDFDIGTDGGTGVVNVDAGTITTGGWNFFGKHQQATAVGGNGTLNMAGGTLTNSGRTYVGQTTTTGAMNLSGGNYTQNDVLIIGEGTGSHGNVNVTSPASTLTVNSEIWVGQGGGGNGAMTVSAGKVVLNNWLAIGREGSTGILTVSGNGRPEDRRRASHDRHGRRRERDRRRQWQRDAFDQQRHDRRREQPDGNRAGQPVGRDGPGWREPRGAAQRHRHLQPQRRHALGRREHRRRSTARSRSPADAWRDPTPA
jgi:T5SS/PEP-CTERM-associated repeat protein